jgi:hypothetical protein
LSKKLNWTRFLIFKLLLPLLIFGCISLALTTAAILFGIESTSFCNSVTYKAFHSAFNTWRKSSSVFGCRSFTYIYYKHIYPCIHSHIVHNSYIIHTHAYIHTHTYVYVRMHDCMFIYIIYCMCMYVCIYACVHMFIYIIYYMYTHAYTYST